MMILLNINDIWKGADGVSTSGVAAAFVFFDRRDFSVLPSNVCPIGVDPICP